MKKEPAIIVGALVAVVQAVVGLLIAFGVNVSAEQLGAIVACVTAICTLVGAVYIRTKVYAPATVKELVTNARK